MSNGGRVGCSENKNPIADGLEGSARMLRGRGALFRETERALARRDRCRGSYVHPTLLSPSTHVVQGCLPSHFWWGDVSLIPWIGL